MVLKNEPEIVFSLNIIEQNSYYSLYTVDILKVVSKVP